VKHTFESASDIAGSIRKFYTTEALKQFYKIVGALDFVGNPTMLVTSFFSGIRDLIVTPHTAIMNSPRDPSRLGIGVAKVCFRVDFRKLLLDQPHRNVRF
jgi:vacuolar protein sorting-associated protein 13A/C